MKEVIPRIWWSKSNREIEDRAEECRKSGLDQAYQACLDELERRKS
jgi:hypothetical protein